MRLSAKTMTVLDIPLSPAQFWTSVAICGALVLAVVFALRPVLRAIIGMAGLS